MALIDTIAKLKTLNNATGILALVGSLLGGGGQGAPVASTTATDRIAPVTTQHVPSKAELEAEKLKTAPTRQAVALKKQERVANVAMMTKDNQTPGDEGNESTHFRALVRGQTGIIEPPV